MIDRRCHIDINAKCAALKGPGLEAWSFSRWNVHFAWQEVQLIHVQPENVHHS